MTYKFRACVRGEGTCCVCIDDGSGIAAAREAEEEGRAARMVKGTAYCGAPAAVCVTWPGGSEATFCAWHYEEIREDGEVWPTVDEIREGLL